MTTCNYNEPIYVCELLLADGDGVFIWTPFGEIDTDPDRCRLQNMPFLSKLKWLKKGNGLHESRIRVTKYIQAP